MNSSSLMDFGKCDCVLLGVIFQVLPATECWMQEKMCIHLCVSLFGVWFGRASVFPDSLEMQPECKQQQSIIAHVYLIYAELSITVCCLDFLFLIEKLLVGYIIKHIFFQWHHKPQCYSNCSYSQSITIVVKPSFSLSMNETIHTYRASGLLLNLSDNNNTW